MRNVFSRLFRANRLARSLRVVPRTTVERLEGRQLMSADPAALAAAGFEPVEWNGQTAYAKPGQWILSVGGHNGSAKKQLDAVNASLKQVRNDLKATRHLGQDGVVRIQTPEGLSHGELKAQLNRGLHGFKHVEPDFALWTDATVNDAYYAGHQYALNNTGQTGGTAGRDIDAEKAWDITRGNGTVVVGVIDSGVDYNHPDLARNVWTNSREGTAADGVDNDGNGYVDDLRGWDFFNDDNNPMDDNGHGTHVAGTIAAAANDAAGVAGVANAKVMPLKFLGGDGTGYTSDAIAAVNYATDMRRNRGVNVRLTNNSWGGGGGYSQSLYDAIAAHNTAGVMFVAAAGNGGADQIGDNNDSVASYPANYDLPNVISVAATDHNDVLGSFSNYGATTVDLAAPGVQILSTYPGGWGYSSGTSMATPHVAGVAALAWSLSPNASVAHVRSALLSGTEAVSGLTGKTATGGRLNAHRTLQILQAPAAPTGLAAAAASASQINLTWTDTSTNEDGFRVERSTDGGVTWTARATLGANATAFADTGLTAGTTYTYRVRAYNVTGNSAYSNTAAATTPILTLPAAPTNLVGKALSKSQIRLTWQDNATNESGYRIERSRDGYTWAQVATVGANSTAYTDSGLARRTTYYYRVVAYNAAGLSAYATTGGIRTL